MKRPAFVLPYLLSFLWSHAQRVQTIVPRQVIAGNAFQIQYIINDPSELLSISPPEFDQLQLISGPNYYKGNSIVNGKTQAIENITYTVVPIKTGSIRISSITATFKNNEEEKTDDVLITVLPQPKASFNALSTYTDLNLYALSSKADLDKMVDGNLFIKTEVDKRICFLGEAITATFKLYSRLQSTSEVINAPSLYGFSVMDMLNINEAHQSVENINGKIFNTSILRKLQLYPAQSGRLTIDEMQLQNTIEFNDSASGKKIKVEKLLASDPVEIAVRPLPSKEPPDYTGAVGQFGIHAELLHSRIAANTQTGLVVTISGRGNFIQFGPPMVGWPKEFDVFDPLVSDEINKNIVPTEGKRSYVFSFASDQAGNYLIPPVSFSFFDPSSHRFKKITSDSLRVEITASKGNVSHGPKQQETVSKSPWFYLAGIALALTAVFSLFWKKKKAKARPASVASKPSYHQKLNSISSTPLTDKEYYAEIQKLLSEASKEYQLSQEQNRELREIQNQCQLLIYTDLRPDGKKEEMRKKVGLLLKQIES